MIKKLKMRFVLVNMIILTFVLVSILSSIYIMMKQSEINVSNQIMDTLIENHRKNNRGHDKKPEDRNPDSKREIQAKLASGQNQSVRLVRLADFEAYEKIPSEPQDEVQPWPFWNNSYGAPDENVMWGNWGNFDWGWWGDPNMQWGGDQNQNPPPENDHNDSSDQNQGDGQQNQWGGDPWAGWGDPNQWGGNQNGNGDQNNHWGGGDPWAGWGDPNQWGGNQDGNGDQNNQWGGGDPWAGWGDYNPYENPPWPGWPNWPPAEESSAPQESQSSAPETNPAPSYAPEARPSYSPETSPSPAPDITEPEETEAQTEETSKAPAESSKEPIKPSDPPPPEKYDGNLVRSHIIADVDNSGKLVDLSLQYFLRYADDTIEDEESFTEKVKFRVNNIVNGSETTGKCTVDNVSFRYKLDSSGPGNMQTLILLDRSIEISTLERLFVNFIIIGCAGFVVVFFVSLFLAAWAIKPIEVAWNRQKQFIADASHELKTPLTVIATNTDVVLSTPNDLIRNQERWLKYIKSETSRMTKLVTELLYIAKSDSNEIRMDMHDFDVSNVVSGVCLNFEAHAFEEQRELVADISPRLKYFGDEDRIKQLVTILIDNAIKYSIIGSQISVSLFRNNQNRIKLCVSNKCENLTEENISKLFDRFYRVDSSRNSETGGNGLGLNIAQAIAEAHNGIINVNYNHGIISFTVTL